MKRNVFGIIEADVSTTARARLAKEKEYMDYIKTHIENVQKAYDGMCKNPKLQASEPIRKALEELKLNIASHDASKYSDSEFEPYRKNFHSINDEEKAENEEDFERAWEHHYTVNSHHPEYWIHDNVILDMSLPAILEMLCDWKASSERHADGNIYRSIEINQSRFGYSDEVKDILKNTVDFLNSIK